MSIKTALNGSKHISAVNIQIHIRFVIFVVIFKYIEAMVIIQLLIVVLIVQCRLIFADTVSPFEENQDLPFADKDIEFVLIGATGDLAKKYLWPAIFAMFQEFNCNSEVFRVFAATRQPTSDIGLHLKEHVFNSLPSGNAGNKQDYRSCRQAFSQSVVPWQLKSSTHYQELGKAISVKWRSRLATILVYLAVPPFTYEHIVKLTSQFLRIDKTELKVVIEKPFGHDYNSSKDLLTKIGKHLNEDEIYRIDHYLGKQTVDEIVRFRKRNDDILTKFLRTHKIDSLEVVMKEKVDCKGRTGFYDRYGVVLDVMQNHLTEVLARVLMDLPEDTDNVLEFINKKRKSLMHLHIPSTKNFIIGQYKGYNDHVSTELGEGHNSSLQSTTPTFATVLIHSMSSIWKDVPIIFVSGKQLNEKSTFVRIKLGTQEESKFAVDTFEEENEVTGDSIVFYIHSAVLNGPAIAIYGSLANDNVTAGNSWHQVKSDCLHCKIFQPKFVVQPYLLLLKSAVLGQRSKFVGKEELLDSWKLWSPLVNKIQTATPLMYDKLQLGYLNFQFTQKALYNIHSHVNNLNADKEVSLCKSSMLSTSGFTSYNNFSVTYLAHKIASKIACLSHAALEGNRHVHIALPGGTSVKHIVKSILRKKDLIQWSALEIWLVDERCVSMDDKFSNYNLLKYSLFDKAPLKHENIHGIVINGADGNCHTAAQEYEAKIRTTIPNQSFDLIILGLGYDSHIASIFPADKHTIFSKSFVTVHSNGPKDNIPKRVTLTPAILKHAKSIAVLVFGKRKKSIYQDICFKMNAIDHLEMLTEKAAVDKLIEWYVDGHIGSCTTSKYSKEEL